jgi:uncharacterized membrane protein HdeD (DUF308 family)
LEKKNMLSAFTQLFRNWWIVAVRGVLAIVFGILALVWPDTTKLALVLLFGTFALIDGFSAVAAGIVLAPHFRRWWALLLEGLTGITIGVLTFSWPNVTGLVLLYFIAAWAVITGIFEIVAAIQFRKVVSGEWAMILSGILSILLGVLLFAFPSAGAVSIVWLIGLYAIAFGIMGLVLAFRLRGMWRKIEKFGVTA